MAALALMEPLDCRPQSAQSPYTDMLTGILGAATFCYDVVQAATNRNVLRNSRERQKKHVRTSFAILQLIVEKL